MPEQCRCGGRSERFPLYIKVKGQLALYGYEHKCHKCGRLESEWWVKENMPRIDYEAIATKIIREALGNTNQTQYLLEKMLKVALSDKTLVRDIVMKVVLEKDEKDG